VHPESAICPKENMSCAKNLGVEKAMCIVKKGKGGEREMGPETCEKIAKGKQPNAKKRPGLKGENTRLPIGRQNPSGKRTIPGCGGTKRGGNRGKGGT